MWILHQLSMLNVKIQRLGLQLGIDGGTDMGNFLPINCLNVGAEIEQGDVANKRAGTPDTNCLKIWMMVKLLPEIQNALKILLFFKYP
jgi:hypothetical protein